MSDEEKTRLLNQLYQALQGISGCPGKCQCCEAHTKQMRAALTEYVQSWRPPETR